jgi:hypothetical protein
MRLVAELRRAARERGGAAARSIDAAETLLNGETLGHQRLRRGPGTQSQTQCDHEAK